jgi:hypothetical protein
MTQPDISHLIKYLYPHSAFFYEIYPDDEDPESTFDERLRWNPTDFDNIKEVTLDVNRIWV